MTRTAPSAARWVTVVVLTALVVALALSAYWQLFTTFRFWDDEGYVLVSLRNFAASGPLYTEVFSQYGPVYNLLFGLLHRGAGVPLDTESARWLTLAMWLGATLASAWLILRLTRFWLWSVAAALVVFHHLRLLTHEPLHPVGLISLLLTGGTAATVWTAHAGNRAAAWAIGAATGTLLALIKINVGLFYLAGLGIVLLWTTRSPAASRFARVVLLVVATAAGILLMLPLRAEPWVLRFIVVYALATIMTLTILVSELSGDDSLWSAGRAALLTATGVVLGVVVLSAATGVTLPALWEGVIRGPLRHPASFSYSFRWAGLTLPVLGANGAAFLLWLFLRSRQSCWTDRWLAAVRLAISAGLLFSYFHAFAVSVEAYLLSFGPGFLWALAARLGPAEAGRDFARHLLAALALFQLLHAYPVAGTQVNIGTVLLALLIVFALAETAVWCADQGWLRIALLVTLLAVILPLWGGVQLSLDAARRHTRQPRESFTGAGLHLSPWQASTLATLTANARWHGDLLFSLPGLFSFNLWTNLPTPTAQNITHWWSLLDESRQGTIATRLRAAARPVIIIQRNLISAGLARTSYRPTPLTRFLDDEFTPLFSLDSYEFRVRRGVPVLPLGIAHWRPGPNAREFSFCLPAGHLLTRAPITWIALLDYQHAAATPRRLAPAEFHVTSEPESDGKLLRWTCRLDAPPAVEPTAFVDAVRFLDSKESVLAEVRFERPSPQANPE